MSQLVSPSPMSVESRDRGNKKGLTPLGHVHPYEDTPSPAGARAGLDPLANKTPGSGWGGGDRGPAGNRLTPTQGGGGKGGAGGSGAKQHGGRLAGLPTRSEEKAGSGSRGEGGGSSTGTRSKHEKTMSALKQDMQKAHRKAAASSRKQFSSQSGSESGTDALSMSQVRGSIDSSTLCRDSVAPLPGEARIESSQPLVPASPDDIPMLHERAFLVTCLHVCARCVLCVCARACVAACTCVC